MENERLIMLLRDLADGLEKGNDPAYFDWEIKPHWEDVRAPLDIDNKYFLKALTGTPLKKVCIGQTINISIRTMRPSDEIIADKAKIIEGE